MPCMTSYELHKFIFISLFFILHCSPSTLFPPKIYKNPKPLLIFISLWNHICMKRTNITVVTWLYCGQEGRRSQISVTATSTRNCHSDRPVGFNETTRMHKLHQWSFSFQTGHLIFKLWMLCLSWGFRKFRRGIIKVFLLSALFQSWFLRMCQFLISINQKQPLSALIYHTFTWEASPIPSQSDWNLCNLKVGLQFWSRKLRSLPHTQIGVQV